MEQFEFAHAPTQQELEAIRHLAFFTQTVCHLNPTKADPTTMSAYLTLADRVMELVVKVPG